MLDFADVVAINKFERRGAEDALRDVRRQLVRNREAFGAVAGGHAGLRHQRRHASTTTASPRSTSTCAACSPSTGWPVGEGTLPPVDGKASTERDRGRPAAAARATWPRSPRPCAATTPTTDAQVDAGPARASSCARPTAALEAARADHGGLDDAADAGRAQALDRRTSPSLLDDVAGVGRGLLRRRAGRAGARQGAAHPADRASRCPAARCPRVALPRYDDDGELLRFLRAENLPGHFPFTAGVFPFKREGEDPARMFAGEGDAFRTNRRFQLPVRGPAGHPAVDRVRLGHALRPRPRQPPGHLRQGRHLRRVDRHARRHEGALRRLRPLRPDHVGVDDDQRPGADDPRHVPQHRDRPAGRRRSRAEHGRAARRRRARRASRACALRQRPRHGAGRHPQGGPGPEHLHLLHRVLACG